jgi:hypothetical protein
MGSDITDPARPEPKQATQLARFSDLPVRPGDRPGRRVAPRLGEALLLVQVSGDVVSDDVHILLEQYRQKPCSRASTECPGLS